MSSVYPRHQSLQFSLLPTAAGTHAVDNQQCGGGMVALMLACRCRRERLVQQVQHSGAQVAGARAGSVDLADSQLAGQPMQLVHGALMKR
jgi:hypothetical protein